MFQTSFKFYLLFCWTHRKIFWKPLTIDFHSVFTIINVNSYSFLTFFKISSFVLVWSNWMMSKCWQKLHFWLNYPLNSSLNVWQLIPTPPSFCVFFFFPLLFTFLKGMVHSLCYCLLALMSFQIRKNFVYLPNTINKIF